MFILILKYVKPLEEVEKELDRHISYLDKYYSMQMFICSGRRNPRIGGVILCNAKDMKEVETIIEEDPFYLERIAEYEIIEFLPGLVGMAEFLRQFDYTKDSHIWLDRLSNGDILKQIEESRKREDDYEEK